MRSPTATRLDRLYVESGEYFEELTVDGGHSEATASELARAMLASGCTLDDEDLAYVRDVADGTREDDQPA